MSRTKTELPGPLYAAAGAGEIAYQRLRRLPEVTARTAETLRRRLAGGERDLTTELTQVRTQVRDSARRGAEVLAARAAGAQEKAATGYRRLVVRGERVVSERFGVATGHAEPPTRVDAVVGEPDPVGPAAAVTTAPAERPDA